MGHLGSHADFTYVSTSTSVYFALTFEITLLTRKEKKDTYIRIKGRIKACKLTQKYEVHFPSILVLVNYNIQTKISGVLANDYTHPHLLHK